MKNDKTDQNKEKTAFPNMFSLIDTNLQASILFFRTFVVSLCIFGLYKLPISRRYFSANDIPLQYFQKQKPFCIKVNSVRISPDYFLISGVHKPKLNLPRFNKKSTFQLRIMGIKPLRKNNSLSLVEIILNQNETFCFTPYFIDKKKKDVAVGKLNSGFMKKDVAEKFIKLNLAEAKEETPGKHFNSSVENLRKLNNEIDLLFKLSDTN
eukprot:snap_masked-scaffold_50-processed-gene-1.50-mRNA-1 protein AED:1.00 eAED:1.00 QI:0/-1/0/0/-1/1/1/0/208